MQTLQDAPERVQQLILVGVVGYFLVWIVGAVTESGLLLFASEILFGLIALAVGGVLLRRAPRSEQVVRASGGLLALGGITQLVYLALTVAGVSLYVLYQISAAFVFAGVGAYVYVIWVAR